MADQESMSLNDCHKAYKYNIETWCKHGKKYCLDAKSKTEMLGMCRRREMLSWVGIV